MDPSHLDENGEYRLDPIPLGTKTAVVDGERNRVVMVLDGVVVLPVGAQVELLRPNVSAIVTGIRLLAGTPTDPATVCVEVKVPAEYWGEEEGPSWIPLDEDTAAWFRSGGIG